MKTQHLRLLSLIAFCAIIGVFFIKPIVQDNKYHQFADQSTVFFIPNFLNVVSNLPFIIIGLLGFMTVLKTKSITELKWSYVGFFVGIFLTGFGSGYYHYNPTDETLVWDRLPMTIGFMSFLSIIIGEFIDIEKGKKALVFLLIMGCSSILYWVVFKDLRMYVLVQFLPLLLVPIVLFLSRNHQKLKKYFWMILTAYLLAKLLENKDLIIFNATFSLISGHTLKHLAAAIAPLIFYKFIKTRFQKTDYAT